MKIRTWPKFLLVAFALSLLANNAWADTILANGNFSEGKAHWRGDGKNASSTAMTDITASLDHSGDVSGMDVLLNDRRWTAVSQVFNTRESSLKFSMTYKTSSDLSLEWLESIRYLNSLGNFIQKLVGFPLKELDDSYPASESALVIISDPTQNLVIYSFVKFPNKPSDSETVSYLFTGLMAHEEKTLFVAFPEGMGKITLSNISLSKPETADVQTSDPFHK